MIAGMAPHFVTKSDRVKAIDVHPSSQIVACALYSGHVTLYDIHKRAQVASITIGKSVPVRAVRFIEAINALICGVDDNQIYVYDATSLERVKVFQAHMDYIRCLAVSSPAQLVFSGGDDARICVWSWTNWEQRTTLMAHSNYVMSLAVSPYDPFLVCSASLDKTVRIWGIQATKSGFTVPPEARCVLRHPSGVNCAMFHPEGGPTLPYIITGADDGNVRVWDYHARVCVYTISEHTDCVTSVACVYSEAQKGWRLISGSEDGFVNAYDMRGYTMDTRRAHSGGRVWALRTACATAEHSGNIQKSNAMLIVGSDADLTVDGPRRSTGSVIGVDRQSGRFVFNVQSEVYLGNLHNATEIDPWASPKKDTQNDTAHHLTTLDSPVTAFEFDPSSQYLAITTLDGYSVLSARSWKLGGGGKCLGEAKKAFAWGQSSGHFAVLTSRRSVQCFANFQKGNEYRLENDAESLSIGANGAVLCAVHTDSIERSGTVSFYDLKSSERLKAVCFGEPIREILWNPDGSRLVVVAANRLYFVEWNHNQGAASFGKVSEVDVNVSGSPQWVDTATLFYLNASTKRVEYILDGQIYCALKAQYVKRIARSICWETGTTQEHPIDFFGYFPRDSRLYCIDRSSRQSGYAVHFASFPCAVVAFQKCLLAEPVDSERLLRIAGHIPKTYQSEMSSFCAEKGQAEIALRCFPDLPPKDRFMLAEKSKNVQLACAIARELHDEACWHKLSALAMDLDFPEIAIEALKATKNYAKLLVFCANLGKVDDLRRIHAEAVAEKNVDIAFTAAHLAKDYANAMSVLNQNGNADVASAYNAKYLGCQEVRKGVDQFMNKSFNSVKQSQEKRHENRAVPAQSLEEITFDWGNNNADHTVIQSQPQSLNDVSVVFEEANKVHETFQNLSLSEEPIDMQAHADERTSDVDKIPSEKKQYVTESPLLFDTAQSPEYASEASGEPNVIFESPNKEGSPDDQNIKPETPVEAPASESAHSDSNEMTANVKDERLLAAENVDSPIEVAMGVQEKEQQIDIEESSKEEVVFEEPAVEEINTEKAITETISEESATACDDDKELDDVSDNEMEDEGAQCADEEMHSNDLNEKVYEENEDNIFASREEFTEETPLEDPKEHSEYVVMGTFDDFVDSHAEPEVPIPVEDKGSSGSLFTLDEPEVQHSSPQSTKSASSTLSSPKLLDPQEEIEDMVLPSHEAESLPVSDIFRHEEGNMIFVTDEERPISPKELEKPVEQVTDEFPFFVAPTKNTDPLINSIQSSEPLEQSYSFEIADSRDSFSEIHKEERSPKDALLDIPFEDVDENLHQESENRTPTIQDSYVPATETVSFENTASVTEKTEFPNSLTEDSPQVNLESDPQEHESQSFADPFAEEGMFSDASSESASPEEFEPKVEAKKEVYEAESVPVIEVESFPSVHSSAADDTKEDNQVYLENSTPTQQPDNDSQAKSQLDENFYFSDSTDSEAEEEESSGTKSQKDTWDDVFV